MPSKLRKSKKVKKNKLQIQKKILGGFQIGFNPIPTGGVQSTRCATNAFKTQKIDKNKKKNSTNSSSYLETFDFKTYRLY